MIITIQKEYLLLVPFVLTFLCYKAASGEFSAAAIVSALLFRVLLLVDAVVVICYIVQLIKHIHIV